MLAAGRQLASGTGGNLVAVLLGSNAQDLAANLAADKVLYMDHQALAEFTPDAYQLAMTELIKAESPRAILFGDTSVGAEVAGALSARLDLPLVSRCSRIEVKDGDPK